MKIATALVSWLLGLLCAGASAASGQAELTRGLQRIDLWPHATVLHDSSRALGHEQVLQMRSRFEAPRTAHATLGMGNDSVWLLVPVVVREGAQGPWVLDFDYALLNSVEVHVLRGGVLVHRAKLGTGHPFVERPLASRTLAVAMDLLVGPAELLVRVDTGGARILAIHLERPAAFHSRALNEQLVQGALLCLSILLILYSLVQWRLSGERLHLKYALLAVCSSMFSVHFFGLGEMYLWGDATWPKRHMAGVTSLLATTATALFIEDTLAGSLAPVLRKALLAVAALHVAAAVAHGLDLIDIRAVGIIMSTTGIAPSLLGLPGAIRRLRDGDSIGGWFIVAWIGYFVASATLIGVVRGYVPANDWTMHSFQIGATLDMLVFMYIAMRQTAMRLREQRRLRRSFSGYVSPGVLAEIIGGRLTPDTGGENRFVCLLFSDIRGYTTRAEGMKPREVLDFLNRYYDRVVAIVHRNGGTVISFMGDGFLAVFGAPQVLDNPCQSGFEAAGEMLRHMRELDRELAAEGVAPIDIGIGLHAGEAVLGHIGGAQRHEYAAIGDVTNVCARLEAQTKEVGYRLVVSGTVVERLTTSTPPVRLGLLKLKGHSPVEAYAFDPVAESGAANSWSATTIARVDTPKGR